METWGCYDIWAKLQGPWVLQSRLHSSTLIFCPRQHPIPPVFQLLSQRICRYQIKEKHRKLGNCTWPTQHVWASSGRTQTYTSYQALRLTTQSHSIFPRVSQTNRPACTHPLEFCYHRAGSVAQFPHSADTEAETKPRTEAWLTDKSLSRNKQLNCLHMLRKNTCALDFSPPSLSLVSDVNEISLSNLCILKGVYLLQGYGNHIDLGPSSITANFDHFT